MFAALVISVTWSMTGFVAVRGSGAWRRVTSVLLATLLSTRTCTRRTEAIIVFIIIVVAITILVIMVMHAVVRKGPGCVAVREG